MLSNDLLALQFWVQVLTFNFDEEALQQLNKYQLLSHLYAMQIYA